MEHLLLSIGEIGPSRPSTAGLAELAEAAAGRVGAGVRPIAVPATARELDSVLAGLTDGQRLLVEADVAGLQLLLARLLRAGLLGELVTSVFPRRPIGYLRRLGLPESRAGQLAALSRPPRLIGVVKDDSGGVCVDHARLGPWPAGGPGASGAWWLRAVVDDERLCDGPARALTMTRVGPGELVATVSLGRFRRRTITGRSLQLACDEALINQDGVPRERPRSKRTLWSEPELWRCTV